MYLWCLCKGDHTFFTVFTCGIVTKLTGTKDHYQNAINYLPHRSNKLNRDVILGMTASTRLAKVISSWVLSSQKTAMFCSGNHNLPLRTRDRKVSYLEVPLLCGTTQPFNYTGDFVRFEDIVQWVGYCKIKLDLWTRTQVRDLLMSSRRQMGATNVFFSPARVPRCRVRHYQ